MVRAGFLLALCVYVACAQPVHLRTEYRVNPIGMDEPRPRLTWMLQGSMMQSAYQVRVASEARPGLFDSGKIVSSANSTVYDGPALRSRDRVSWQVRVWDERDVPTEWSEPASFEMGLLAREDWTARWIAHPAWQHGDPMPVFRRRFAVAKAVDRARLYITGLGMYSAAMNGREVTPDVLTPGNTLYTQRVEYGAYDVTPLLITGENSLVVELGNGIFNSVKTADRYFGLTFPSAAPVRMIAQLEIAFTDGTSQIQASGSEWETALGATTVSTWFGGEDYDARREIAGWGHAAVAEPPAGDPKLTWRAGPGVRTYATALPVGVTEPRPGVHVFDMGVNLAGWPQIHVSGTRGTTVRMKIGELLGSDGLVREDTVGGNIYDSYTLSGNGLESWHPKFAYHGFRYVQVTGLPAPPARNTLSAIPLRGANEVAGTFTSSNTLFNEIHAIIRRAIESNMFSIFTDCPDREKLGWLGDMIGIFGSITRNFDVAAYMTTILDNMADSQVASGMVPTFVPTYADYSIYGEGFRDDVNWGSALILAPWYLYETYGDRRPMEKHYDGMQRYFNYLASRAKGSLLDYGLGDWISPDTRMPREVIATYGLYRCTVAMQRVASVLGREEDAAFYERYAADVAAAFNAKYLNRERHYYADGQQAADAIALDMGVVPEDEKAAVLAHLIATIRADGNHFRAGIVSLQAILRALHNAGRDDVICDAAVQTTAPSYGFQVVKGATTLTEEWSGPEVGASQNHMMLGAIDEWFNAGLAGIQQAPDSVGYREVVIRPAIVGDLQHVRGAYNSVRGLIQSEWTRDDSGRVRMTVTLPAGVTGTVHVPTAGGFEARRVGPGFHEFTGTAAPPFTAGGSAGPSRERRRARRDSLQWRDPAPWPAPPVRRIR